MSATRTVRVISTKSSGGTTVTTGVGTLGELKTLVSDIDWNGMKVTVRPSNVVMNDDSSLLPDGDCRIYLTPISVKGASELSKENYSKLQDLISIANDALLDLEEFVNDEIEISTSNESLNTTSLTDTEKAELNSIR